MKSLKKIFAITILIILYLIFSVRYYQGNFSKTALETCIHMLTVAPFLIGGTLVLVSVLRKVAGERLSWEAVIRIYLTLGIFVEFILGIYHYVNQG